ncbi:hypothetical protein [Halorussus caseinilyticus]|uniref:Uncharacterized protein n=1 Tax=Halorussus caseinilyticus TaxID=3034025 RepID=A0ABD5WH23_9EURY
MKPTRRRVLLGLGAVVGGGSLAYAGRDGERTRMGVRDRATDTEQTSETTAEEATTTDAETTTEEATTTERDVEFPDQFVRMSFDTRDSLEKFTELDVTENVEIDERGVVSESNSLRVTFPEGRHYGTSLHYRFDEAGYPEPDELHARYYLRFAETFDLSHGGGKLPGPSGTYGQAGWGGREADGTNGWSARMYFHPSYDDDHPIQLSSYVYHAEMGGPYGDIFEWNDSDAGRLHVGKWYRIDNYLRLNTPGEDDGVLKGWVNGERALT